EAIPDWRPSKTHGLDHDKRERHLKISHKRGIYDFGVDQGYSPINLVMTARNCSRVDAVAWLQERVEPAGKGEGGFEAILASAPSIQPGREKAESPTAGYAEGHGGAEHAPVGPDGRERIRPGKLIGEAWYFGDPVPEQPPMLVPGFIPARGWGYIGG